MVYNSIVAQPLTEMSIDSDGDFMESDVAIDDSDEDDERIEGVTVSS